MAQTVIIDPLAIATQGFLTTNNPQIDIVGIATDGLWIVIEEEIVEPEEPGFDPRLSGGGVPDDTWEARQRKKKKKKITAKVYIGGEEFKETVMVEDLTLELKDVRISVSLDENQKPTLKIVLPEGVE